MLLCISTSASATYTMIVAQEPGGGTSVWASIIAKHLEKYLGEEIVLRHIPGARDIPGFNEFHNKLRFDEKTIMVSHGAHAESYLIEKVDFSYKEYDPIGGMNLSAVTAYHSSFDPYSHTQIKFSTGSGFNPDAMAMTLLVCGNLKSLNEYLKCYNDKIIFVRGMKAGERRLAFSRKELNVTRESTAAFIKFVQPLIDKNEAVLWFNHGVFDATSKQIIPDPNFKKESFFLEIFKSKWKELPHGPLYDAYLLVKQHRDILQKSLWMNKNNPNSKKVQGALRSMINDKTALLEIERDSGKYQWLIGNDLVSAVEYLQTTVNPQNLQNLVIWEKSAFGVDAVLKPQLIKQH